MYDHVFIIKQNQFTTYSAVLQATRLATPGAKREVLRCMASICVLKALRSERKRERDAYKVNRTLRTRFLPTKHHILIDQNENHLEEMADKIQGSSMIPPAQLIFRYLQNKERVCIWLHGRNNLRIEGVIAGFDIYMNMVIMVARWQKPDF